MIFYFLVFFHFTGKYFEEFWPNDPHLCRTSSVENVTTKQQQQLKLLPRNWRIALEKCVSVRSDRKKHVWMSTLVKMLFLSWKIVKSFWSVQTSGDVIFYLSKTRARGSIEICLAGVSLSLSRALSLSSFSLFFPWIWNKTWYSDEFTVWIIRFHEAPIKMWNFSDYAKTGKNVKCHLYQQ